MTWETFATTAIGILGIIVAADYAIGKSQTIIQNTVGPLLWAFFTGKPIKSAQGGNIMAFSLADMEIFITKMEEFGDRGLKAVETLAIVVEKLAPIAEAIAPLTGSAAPAVLAGAELAQGIAPVVVSRTQALEQAQAHQG